MNDNFAPKPPVGYHAYITDEQMENSRANPLAGKAVHMTEDDDGNKLFEIGGYTYKVMDLIWALSTGVWPLGPITTAWVGMRGNHIDGLRDTGDTGIVYVDEDGLEAMVGGDIGAYGKALVVDGKFIGIFDDPREAEQAMHDALADPDNWT